MNRLFFSAGRCVLWTGLVVLFSGCVESDTSNQDAKKAANSPTCCCDLPSPSSLISAKTDKDFTPAVDAAFADLVKDEALAAADKAAFEGEPGKEVRALVLARLSQAARQCPAGKEETGSETKTTSGETVKTMPLSEAVRKALKIHLTAALETHRVECCDRETLLIQVDQLFTPVAVSVTPDAGAKE